MITFEKSDFWLEAETTEPENVMDMAVRHHAEALALPTGVIDGPESYYEGAVWKSGSQISRAQADVRSEMQGHFSQADVLKQAKYLGNNGTYGAKE